MKKSDISAHVTAKTSLSKSHAAGAVDAISDALAQGESLSIAGFGIFTVKSRPERQGRNPWTAEMITIAASKSPSFKAGKTLRDTLR